MSGPAPRCCVRTVPVVTRCSRLQHERTGASMLCAYRACRNAVLEAAT